MATNKGDFVLGGFIATGLFWTITVGVGFGLWGCPRYSVWQQSMVGQGELARADQNRKIKVAEALAIKESAEMLADAEVARAKGVAQANKIIGEGLTGHEEYLRYLWIMSLEHTAAQGDKVIYVPTEAGLPILEANRLNNTIQKGQ